MKKIICIALLMMCLLSFASVSVYGAGTIVGSHNGAVGAGGTWDGVYEKEAKGDSLVMCFSGDAFGYVFEDVPAGVYKIAHYLSLDSMEYGKRIRISPRVSSESSQLRCWVDWYTADVIATVSDVLNDDQGKIILVSVITVPWDGAHIDVGFWQDTGAYVGTLDKVVLATADYDFYDDTYALVGEKSYDADHVFNEDPEQKLLGIEGSWVSSTLPTPAPLETPEIVPEQPEASHPINDAVDEKSDPAFVDQLQMGLLISIIVVVLFGIAGTIFLVKKKK